MAEVYKVVTVTERGKLLSGYIPWFMRYSRLVKEYRPGQTVTDDGMKLFAFSSRRKALAWCIYIQIYQDNRGEVWKAEATGVEPLSEMVPLSLALARQARAFWRDWGNGLRGMGLEKPPDGTVACDSIKLIERVA